MLVKLTPVDNFTNILREAFNPISFCQKNYKPKLFLDKNLCKKLSY